MFSLMRNKKLFSFLAIITSIIMLVNSFGVAQAAPLSDVTTNIDDPAWAYTGTGWSHYTVGCCSYNSTYAASSVTGDYTEFTFTGYMFKIYGRSHDDRGIANLYIDGVSSGTIDFYLSTTDDSHLVYTSGTLSSGLHTVRLTVSGTKNSSSSGYVITPDYAQSIAYNPTATPTITPTVGPTATPTLTPTPTSTPAPHPNPYWYPCGSGATPSCPVDFSVAANGTVTGGSNDNNFTVWSATLHRSDIANLSGLTVYTRIIWSFSWTSSTSGTLSIRPKFNVSGFHYDANTYCSGATGTCSGTFTDSRTIGSVDTQNVDTWIEFGGSGFTSFSYSLAYTVQYSTAPFPSENCAGLYQDFSALTWPIDPTIEFPKGPDAVSPDVPDHQIVALQPTVPTTTHTYHVSVEGTWGDGTSTDLSTYDYSFDGTLWNTLEHLTGLTCADSTGFYFTTDEQYFYIRVHDTAGNFSDNTPTDPDLFPVYHLSETTQIAPLTCSDKFTYSPSTDRVATGFVAANSSLGSLVGFTFTVGDWYVLETTAGPWLEGDSSPHYDMRAMTTSPGGHETYSSSADMSTWHLTDCSETASDDGLHMRYYFQADNVNLQLWVNDQDNNFANNTGSLGYNIYHVPPANVMYWPAACELKYKINDLFMTASMDAKAAKGASFVGVGVPSIVINGITDPNTTGTFTFQKDQVYVLETQGGPWRNGTSTTNRWTTDVSTDQGSNWSNTDIWSGADCIVPIDRIGHIRAYFTPGHTGMVADVFTSQNNFMDYNTNQLKIRVSDGSLLNAFADNTGTMKAVIYKTTNVQTVSTEDIPATGACDGQFVVANMGAPIGGAAWPVNPQSDTGIFLPNLTTDGYYAIDTDNYFEDGSYSPDLRTEISDDGGVTWYKIKDYSGTLCMTSYAGAPGHIRMYIQAVAGRKYKIRAYDSDSNRSNNVDHDFGIKIYEAQVVFDPWNTCVQTYQLSPIALPDGNQLDAQSEGIRLPTVDGQLYALKITGGYWWEDSAPTTKLFDAQISLDDGATWYTFDKSFDGVQCAAKNGVYQSIYFKSGPYTRLRVNDRNNDFTDNGGALTFELDAAGNTADSVVNVGIPLTFAGCYSIPAIPLAPTPADGPTITADLGLDLLNIWLWTSITVTNVVDWLGAWINYMVESIKFFFLWCPEHSQALDALRTSMLDHEPFATFAKIKNFITAVQMTIQSYSWTVDTPPAIPFLTGSGGGDLPSLLPEIGSDSPYNGAPIQLGDMGGGTPITSCDAHLTVRLGTSGLAVGFCVIMNLVKLIHLDVFINTASVVACVILAIRYLMNKISPLFNLTYLLTSAGDKE